MMAFVRLAAVDDLWSGEMRGYLVQRQKVLLVRIEDAFYAYEDRCAHQGLALSKGALLGCMLTCSAHHWEYDVCTGAGVNPSSARLISFPLEVDGEAISVDVGEGRR
jgi:toluene monooxygenase system ferredoxin subunit